MFYNETNSVIELFYGKGHVSGNLVTDHVALMSQEVKSVPLKMLAVDKADDLTGTQADGILGMSPQTRSGAELLVKRLAQENVIDAAQFTVFLGTSGESSYVDFGSYKGSLENVTWVPLTDTNYWTVRVSSIMYKNKPLSVPSTKAVLDTGTSILGFPREDLKAIILSMKEDRQLYYLEDVNFYGVRWQNLDEFYDLIIDINGHTTRISSNEYMIKMNEFCIFFLFDLGTNFNFILLGDSYLKGTLMIHDMDNKQVGLFPQKAYYPPHDYQKADYILYLVVMVVVVLFFGCFAAFIYKQFWYKQNDRVDDDEEGYELITGNHN